jgi:uncharacterized RDD family membrane protein YckC
MQGETTWPVAEGGEWPADRARAIAPAGFWRRAVGLGIDLVVVLALVGIGQLVARLVGQFDVAARAFRIAYHLVIPHAYFVLAHGTGGQTLGKVLVGVRVVGPRGETIGYPIALGRLVASYVSLGLGGLGFLLVALRPDKRGLHDLLAGTRVVRAR